MDLLFAAQAHSSWVLTEELSAALPTIEDNSNIFPPKDNIFAAFKYCPLPNLKVVILGQDPYYTRGTAHGLSFSTMDNTIPVSLRNIYSAIKLSVPGFVKPTNGNLQKWAEQGVLLLNTALTVQENMPGSHAKLWEKFTNLMIKFISANTTNVVFMLWGKFAQSYSKMIVNPHNHLILAAPHPAARVSPSFGKSCMHFKEANDYLDAHERGGIRW